MHSTVYSSAVAPVQYAAAFAVALSLLGASANAADSASLEAGSGNKTHLARIGVQWNWDSNWEISNYARLSGYWDLSLAQWKGTRYRDLEGSSQNLTAIGLIPVFRLTPTSESGPYLEIGTGPHLLSEIYDNNRRQLSTRFQFGSFLGIGYVFSDNLDASIRYQHYSNASIKKPNDGVNFFIVRLSYAF